MLAGISSVCDIGGKRGNNGHMKWWRGYKLHLDVADGQIPISALLTPASVHDSQLAIPLMEMSSKRVTYLYDLMDSAYDADAIAKASRARNHQPIINPKRRSTGKAKAPKLAKPQPQLSPAQAERFKSRTMVERVFSRLKDEFGANNLRVRGAKKIMSHLMFGVIALTVDQLLRLHP
jgi:Transposase DDE domain